MPDQTRHDPRLPAPMLLGALLVLSAVLRLALLRASPGWYHDETIYIGEAWNLIHGRFQWDVVRHTFLPRLPLFHLLAGPLMLVLGKDILWVRMIAALSGVGITALVWRMAHETHGRAAAVIAAFAFAVSGYALLFTRFGMSYALDAFLGAANLYALMRYAISRSRSSLLWAISAAAAGMLADPVMGARLVATVIVFWAVANRRIALLSAAAALAPLAAYIAFMTLFFRDLFFADIRIILESRMAGGANWFSMVLSLTALLRAIGGWAYLGLAGLLFVRRGKPAAVLLGVFVIDVLAIMKLSIGDESLALRMGIILCPPLFVGAGALLADAWARLNALLHAATEPMSNSARKISAAIIPFARALAVVCLAVFLVSQAWTTIVFRFPRMPKHYRDTVIDPVEPAENAALWVNAHIQPGDLVIATHVEWLIDADTASPMLVDVAEGGKGSPVYPESLRERFIRPTGLKDARYFIYHQATPRISAIYGVTDLTRQITEEWDVVHREDLTRVYRNPALGNGH